MELRQLEAFVAVATLIALVDEGDHADLLGLRVDAAYDVPGVVRRTWPHLRHESHNEPDGPAVIAAIACVTASTPGGCCSSPPWW